MAKKIVFLYIFSLLFLASGNIFVNAQTVTPTPSPVPTQPTVTEPVTTATPPEIPQGLSAVVVSDTRIDLSWKKSTGASAYEIHRNNELIAVVGSLLYTDTELKSETTYSYKVRAFDGTNYSGFSSAVSATTRAVGEPTLVPTLAVGPQADESKPTVFDSFSFVTITALRFNYNSIQPFPAKEEFMVYGKTIEFSDVEILVKPNVGSYYAKADERGFWQVKVGTEKLEPGDYTFQLIITSEDYPEKYESEDYAFQIIEGEEDEEEAGGMFGSKVSNIVKVLMGLVIVAFLALAFFAYKKGLFNKIFGKDNGDATSPQNNASATTKEVPTKSIEELMGEQNESVSDPVVDGTQEQATTSQTESTMSEPQEAPQTEAELQTAQTPESPVNPPTNPVVRESVMDEVVPSPQNTATEVNTQFNDSAPAANIPVTQSPQSDAMGSSSAPVAPATNSPTYVSLADTVDTSDSTINTLDLKTHAVTPAQDMQAAEDVVENTLNLDTAQVIENQENLQTEQQTNPTNGINAGIQSPAVAPHIGTQDLTGVIDEATVQTPQNESQSVTTNLSENMQVQNLTKAPLQPVTVSQPAVDDALEPIQPVQPSSPTPPAISPYVTKPAPDIEDEVTTDLSEDMPQSSPSPFQVPVQPLSGGAQPSDQGDSTQQTVSDTSNNPQADFSTELVVGPTPAGTAGTAEPAETAETAKTAETVETIENSSPMTNSTPGATDTIVTDNFDNSPNAQNTTVDLQSTDAPQIMTQQQSFSSQSQITPQDPADDTNQVAGTIGEHTIDTSGTQPQVGSESITPEIGSTVSEQPSVAALTGQTLQTNQPELYTSVAQNTQPSTNLSDSQKASEQYAKSVDSPVSPTSDTTVLSTPTPAPVEESVPAMPVQQPVQPSVEPFAPQSLASSPAPIMSQPTMPIPNPAVDNSQIQKPPAQNLGDVVDPASLNTEAQDQEMVSPTSIVPNVDVKIPDSKGL